MDRDFYAEVRDLMEDWASELSGIDELRALLDEILDDVKGNLEL
ncbi:MAG: hypothetical protein ABJM12_18650 [Ekhidna sp.]